MTFEDVHKSYNASGYTCTNEEHYIFRRLLGGRRLESVAAISSAGEIPLFLLLPRVQKRLVAVDHSYKSLACTCMKINLLQRLGPRAAKELLISNDAKKMKPEWERAFNEIPEPLREAVKNSGDRYGYGGKFDPMSWWSGYDFRRHWYHAPVPVLHRTINNLDKLTLVHGDFADVKDRGPFDLLYISNMMEHVNRQQKYPTTKLLEPLVAPRTLVLATGQVKDPDKLWTEVKKETAVHSSWTYYVYKVNNVAKTRKSGNPAGTPAADGAR